MVSVVMPSYGRPEVLHRCLRSVMASDPMPVGGFEVIVVTSGCDEEQRSAIKKAGGRLVELEEPVAVSRSRNAGAAAATGEYLLFLDDDNVVAPDAIQRLEVAIRVNPSLVMVGPAMYFLEAPERLWSAGVRRSRLLLRTRLTTEVGDPAPEQVSSEDFPNCFIVRRQDFEAVGGFDAESFPVHYEESDLARRLGAQRGGVIVCLPAARVWHDIALDLTRRLHMKSPDSIFWLGWGRAMFAARHGTPLQWWAHRYLSQWLFAALYASQAARMRPGERMRGALAYLRGLRAGAARGRLERAKGSAV